MKKTLAKLALMGGLVLGGCNLTGESKYSLDSTINEDKVTVVSKQSPWQQGITAKVKIIQKNKDTIEYTKRYTPLGYSRIVDVKINGKDQKDYLKDREFKTYLEALDKEYTRNVLILTRHTRSD